MASLLAVQTLSRKCLGFSQRWPPGKTRPGLLWTWRTTHQGAHPVLPCCGHSTDPRSLWILPQCSHHSIQILVYIPSAQNNRADAPSRLLITRLGTLAPTATSNEGAGDFPDSLPIIIYYFNHDLVDFNFTQMAQSLFMLKIPASHKAHSSDNHQHKSITFYMLNSLPIWRSECEGCNECCAANTTSENLFRLCLVRSSISLPLLPS